jgi:hypothetical protein
MSVIQVLDEVPVHLEHAHPALAPKGGLKLGIG